MDQLTDRSILTKELTQDQKKRLKQDRMVKRAEHRRSEWIDAVATNDQFVDAYMHGALLLKHPSQVDFRPPCDEEPMYNRRYETSMDRATRKEKEHKQAILEKLNYNENEPNRKYYLRPRADLLEVQPPMRYQPRDKMERIKQSVDSNVRVNLDQLDTKKLYFPVFNQDERHKWVTKKGFSMDGFKQTKKAHWNETSNNNPAGTNPFLNGLQAIADQKVERMRQSHKEISKVPFCSTIAPDQWKNSLVNTNSLRSMKSIHASIDALKLGSSTISTTLLPKIDSFRDTSKILEQSQEVSSFQLNPMKNTLSKFKVSPKISPRSIDGNDSKPKAHKTQDNRNDKKEVKLMKRHMSIISMEKSTDISRTQNIEDMMQQWTNNQSLKIINSDKSPHKGTSNQMYATQTQYFNDQHLSKQIYKEKLYFQSAQKQIQKEKSPAYQKNFGKIKGPNQTFNISDNIFLSTHQSNNKQAVDGSMDQDTSIRYQIRTKDDFKAELEKQKIHSYLQKSIIKQTNFSELVHDLKQNKDEMEESHNMTTSTKITINPGSISLRVLPSLQPSHNTEIQKNQGLLIQVNKGNEPSSLFNSPRSFLKQNAMTPFGQMLKLTKQSPRRNEGSVEKAEEVDFSYRKQQVQKMLGHFFK